MSVISCSLTVFFHYTNNILFQIINLKNIKKNVYCFKLEQTSDDSAFILCHMTVIDIKKYFNI